MATLSRVGRIQSPGISGVVNYNVSAFQPKAILIFGGSTDPTMSPVQTDLLMMMGGSDGTRQFARHFFQPNAAGASTVDFSNNIDRIIFVRNTAAVVSQHAVFNGFTATGFSLNWTTSTVAGQYYTYILLGGDVTPFVGTFTTGTGAGNIVVPATLGGLEPQVVFFFPFWYSEMGVDSLTDKWSWAASLPGGMPTQATSTQSTTHSILTVSGSTPDVQASITAKAADQFTVTKAAATTNTTVNFLALAGMDKYKVGTFNGATALGLQNLPSSGFRPVSILMSSFGFAAGAPAVNDINTAVGAASSSDVNNDSGNMFMRARAGVNPTATGRASTPAVLRFVGPATGSETAGFTLDSFNNDGGVIDWFRVDAVARQLGYVMFGEILLNNPKRLLVLGVGA